MIGTTAIGLFAPSALAEVVSSTPDAVADAVPAEDAIDAGTPVIDPVCEDELCFMQLTSSVRKSGVGSGADAPNDSNFIQERELIENGGFFVMPNNLQQEEASVATSSANLQNAQEEESLLSPRTGSGGRVLGGHFTMSSGNAGGFMQLSAKKYDDAYIGGNNLQQEEATLDNLQHAQEEESRLSPRGSGGAFLHNPVPSFTMTSGNNYGFMQLESKKYNDAYVGGRASPEINLAQKQGLRIRFKQNSISHSKRIKLIFVRKLDFAIRYHWWWQRW